MMLMLATAWWGCVGSGETQTNPSSPRQDSGSPSNPSTSPASPTADTGIAVGPSYAQDIYIQSVSVNQGVEIVLWEHPDTSNAELTTQSLVAGREGLVRIYVTPRPEFQARELRGVLTLLDDASKRTATYQVDRDISDASTSEARDSTFNFRLSPTDLTPTTEMTFDLVELDPTATGQPLSQDVHFDSRTDVLGRLPVEPALSMDLVIVPVRYLADGSGRIPATGSAFLEDVASSLTAMFPITEAHVRVAEPFDFDPELDGEGWNVLVDEMAALREAAVAHEPANTYYLALVQPAPTWDDHCPDGACVTGVAWIAEDAAQPWQRSGAALAFGPSQYPNYVLDNLRHEIGHMHGRRHVPCVDFDAGIFFIPLDADDRFPYAFELGSWGYNSLTDTLLAPDAHNDVLSYCWPSLWISDYNYDAMWRRNDALTRQDRSGSHTVTRPRAPRRHDSVLTCGHIDGRRRPRRHPCAGRALG